MCDEIITNKAHKANDASSCWRNGCMMTWYLRKRDGRMDGQTDRQTDRPSYRDARRYLVRLIYLLGRLFALKYSFPWFLTKAWLTDGRMVRPCVTRFFSNAVFSLKIIGAVQHWHCWMSMVCWVCLMCFMCFIHVLHTCASCALYAHGRIVGLLGLVFFTLWKVRK